MTAPLNGQAVEAPDDLNTEVAKRVVASMQADGADQVSWEDLTEAEREGEQLVAHHYVEAYVRSALSRGFKIIPPGSVASPSSPEEAAAMVQAAKNFMASQKRKQGLLAAPARKLIVPGVH